MNGCSLLREVVRIADEAMWQILFQLLLPSMQKLDVIKTGSPSPNLSQKDCIDVFDSRNVM